MAFRKVMLVGALAASSAFAGWTKQGDATATFSGLGPGGFAIKGETSEVDVADDGKALTVTVGFKTMTTKIDLRDRHMREKYLHVDKYPNATLVVPLAALKVPDDGATLKDVEAKGNFTMHGVTKEATFKYSATCKAGVCDIDGKADLNFNDFGIKVDSYMGITLKPDVKVGTTFHVKK